MSTMTAVRAGILGVQFSCLIVGIALSIKYRRDDPMRGLIPWIILAIVLGPVNVILGAVFHV